MCLSVPQIPQSEILRSAASSGTSGSGNSRSPILPGPSMTAARTVEPVTALASPVLLFYPDPGLALGRVGYRVHDLAVPVTVEERRPLRAHRPVVRDRGQEVVELVHERMVPAEAAALADPVLAQVRVLLGEHVQGPVPAGPPVPLAEENLELVDPFQIEPQRALRPVYLEAQVVHPPRVDPRGLEGPQRPVPELHGRDREVVHVDPLILARPLGHGPLLDYRRLRTRDGAHLSDQV